MAFTLMRCVSGCTCRAAETCRLVLRLCISKEMQTTTRPLARFLRGEGPARHSGRLISIATTWLLPQTIKKRQRFWCMHRKIDRKSARERERYDDGVRLD